MRYYDLCRKIWFVKINNAKRIIPVNGRIKTDSPAYIDKVKAGEVMKERVSFGMIFLVGFVAGMIVMNFGKSILLENTGLLDENMLKQMVSAFPEGNALFAFVLRKRISVALVMILLATTYLGVVLCVVYDLWLGFSAGIFLTASVLRYGFKGLFLVAAGILPQYLIYAPVLYILLVWCDRTCRMIYGRNRSFGENIKTPDTVGRVLPLVVILAGLIGGCFLESYVNPGILQGAIKML